ncbi:hypothetical protein [Dongia sp.]|uniref:hypothetical protein n=1 Tax=Dongia sp. TaxID=1977262 RepID=UPI0035B16713
MRKVARVILYLLIAAIVGGAILFVWAMQREIDISTPEAREQQKRSMVLGCKVKLPELLKEDPALAALEIAPAQAEEICGCAADQILTTYGAQGTIRPTDVPEAEIDAAELACVKDVTAQ